MDDPQAGPSPPAADPPPGSPEWLTAQDPAAPALVHAPGPDLRTRAEHEATATALAHGLRTEFGVLPGDHVALALPPSPALAVLPYALAKLGAAPLLLDPADPAAAATARRAGARLLVATGTPAAPGVLPLSAVAHLEQRHHGREPLLSTGHPPVDALTATGDRRLLVRHRTPERIARLAAPFGDLLRRVGLRPGTVMLLGPGAHRPEPQFWAGVTFVTGGSLVCEPRGRDGRTLLQAISKLGVGAAVLDREALAAIIALPDAVTESADLTELERIIVDGPPPDAALLAACADLFGDDVVHRVAATPQTGAYGHADAAALARDPDALTLLDGVTAIRADDGAITAVSSPLTADGALGGPAERGGWPAPPGWTGAPVPTGD